MQIIKAVRDVVLGLIAAGLIGYLAPINASLSVFVAVMIFYVYIYK